MVKNDKHQTRAIILPNGQEIEIENQDVKNFLAKMQYEVDQYAKSVHRRKRIKASLEGKLITINGIGEITIKKLLTHFKNYANIYNASLEELSKIVSKTVAQKIKDQL